MANVTVLGSLSLTQSYTFLPSSGLTVVQRTVIGKAVDVMGSAGRPFQRYGVGGDRGEP